MNEQQFRAQASADGFTEIETTQIAPRAPRGEHGHDYTIRGLVLSGLFNVTQNAQTRSYGPGEIFEVAQDDPHDESIGADGAHVVIARKYRAG